MWWPNGIGEPYIYDFEVRLGWGGKLVSEKKITYGIRTVRLDQTNNTFTVVVNGYKIYCKGANYVPPDMFYPRLTNKRYQDLTNKGDKDLSNKGHKGKDRNSIHKLLNDSVLSNFNMIRVWGGGQY